MLVRPTNHWGPGEVGLTQYQVLLPDSQVGANDSPVSVRNNKAGSHEATRVREKKITINKKQISNNTKLVLTRIDQRGIRHKSTTLALRVGGRGYHRSMCLCW